MARQIETFLEMMTVERAAANNTLAAYRRDLDDLESFLTQRKVGVMQAEGADLAAYMRALAHAGMSTRTQARRLSCLRQFYGFVYAEGWRPDDPTSRIDFPRLGRTLPKVLTEGDVDKLLQAARALPAPAGPMMTALLELLYGTGLRVSELVGLPFSSLARDPSILMVRGKGDKDRTVPLSHVTRNAVQAWILLRKESLGKKLSRWLFPALKGNGHLSRAGFARMLLRVGMTAQIDPRRLSPHVLRHAFATHLLAHGADLRVVQELLGHANITTTEIYTHLLDEPKIKLVQQCHPLAGMLKGRE